MTNPKFEKRLMNGVAEKWHQTFPDAVAVSIDVPNHIGPAKWIDAHTKGHVTGEFTGSDNVNRICHMTFYFNDPKEAASFKMFFA